MQTRRVLTTFSILAVSALILPPFENQAQAQIISEPPAEIYVVASQKLLSRKDSITEQTFSIWGFSSYEEVGLAQLGAPMQVMNFDFSQSGNDAVILDDEWVFPVFVDNNDILFFIFVKQIGGVWRSVKTGLTLLAHEYSAFERSIPSTDTAPRYFYASRNPMLFTIATYNVSAPPETQWNFYLRPDASYMARATVQAHTLVELRNYLEELFSSP